MGKGGGNGNGNFNSGGKKSVKKQQTKQAKKSKRSKDEGSSKQQDGGEDGPCHQLRCSLQCLFKRSLQKGECVYEVTSESPFVATLTVKDLSVYGQSEFEGTGETKAEAKGNAAQSVLVAFASQFEEAA